MNQKLPKKGFRRADGRKVLSDLAAGRVPAPASRPIFSSQKPTAAPQIPAAEEDEELSINPELDKVLPEPDRSKQSATLDTSPSETPKPASTPLPLRYYLVLAEEGQFPVCQEFLTEDELTQQLKTVTQELQAAIREGAVNDTRLFVFIGHMAELSTFPLPEVFYPSVLEGESERAVKLYESKERVIRSRSGSLFAEQALDDKIYRVGREEDVEERAEMSDEVKEDSETGADEAEPTIQGMASLMDSGGEAEEEDLDPEESLGD